MAKPRKFKRPSATRRYKKIFVLATEGTNTEPQYFDIVNNLNSNVLVKYTPKQKHQSPQHVLTAMNQYLKAEGIQKSDEAWLVVDKDKWTDTQLSQLYDWTKKANNYYFALSNPKFEYWLLLHFEDYSSGLTSCSCSEKLARHIPKLSKDINWKITKEMIEQAIMRAKQQDNPPCERWPTTTRTTVYRLVGNILNSQIQP